MDLWESRVDAASSGGKEATFVAEDVGQGLIGVVGAFQDQGRLHIWGMWVRPDHRGRGTGRALLVALLAWCEEFVPGVPITLEVNPTQLAAVRLYRAVGFRATGTTRPLGHHPPAVVEEMVRGPTPKP